MVRGRIAFLAIASAIVGYQMFVPPVVGLANTGDFGKVIGIFNLTGPREYENAFAATRYQFNPEKYYWAEFYTCEHVILAAAIVINTVFSKDGYFDIRSIGVIHAALFLLSFYLLWKLLEDSPRPLRFATCGAALFCFTDVMYVSYLNSFYMDVATWLFLSIAALLYLRWQRWRRPADAWCFLLCCAMVITSKSQHSIFGFWMAALVLAAGFPFGPKQRRWTAVSAASLALLSAFWIAKSAPPDYAARGVFTMAFYRILPHAKNVDRTLRDLGLDDSYRRYIGMHSFSEGSPMWEAGSVNRFSSRLSYGGLARYFVTHPDTAYMTLRASLDEAGIQRPYLGNFDVHAGYRPFQESRAFAFWSDWKKRAFDKRGARFFFTFLALALAVATLLITRRRTLPTPAILGGMTLIGLAFTALFVASLADAVDVPRHHLLFYVLFDMLLVLLIHLAVRTWLETRTKT